LVVLARSVSVTVYSAGAFESTAVVAGASAVYSAAVASTVAAAGASASAVTAAVVAFALPESHPMLV
jgi:hypothetical protein